MDWKIPLFRIYWDDDDVLMVKDTIQRGMSWAIGPNIEQFEQMISEYVGTKYAVVFNSGTSALHASLLAHGIGEGDEVIVPSFTFIATVNAALFVGAIPIFADIEEETCGLRPEDVEAKITPRTRAVIPVHYGGCPCLIEQLTDIARRHDLVLVEDAAEALGAKVDGRKIGAFGNTTVLSFCSNKVITTGEGGAVVTDSSNLYDKLRLIRSHGRAEKDNYFSSTNYMDYIALGYNFRMSDVTAALGIAQLKKIDEIIGMRRAKADVISNRLHQVTEIELPHPAKNHYHVYQMYTIRVRGGQDKRDALSAHLAEKGIMSKVYFHPVHRTHFYRNMPGPEYELPVTERVSSQVLTLPLYPNLTENEIDYMANSVADFFSSGVK